MVGRGAQRCSEQESLRPANSVHAWPEFEPKSGDARASPHCFTGFPLAWSLSSFMASRELLKASEEEIKGRILSYVP